MILAHLTPEQFIRALTMVAAAWSEREHNSPALVIEARLIRMGA